MNILQVQGTQAKALENLVAGERVTPEAVEYLDEIDRASGETVARVPLSAEADVDRAMAAAGVPRVAADLTGRPHRALMR